MLFIKRGELLEVKTIPFSINVFCVVVIISGSKLTKAFSSDSITFLLFKLEILKLAIITPAKNKINILFL